MNWKMDFDKTSFSVDWFTPGDKYVPKRLSFPKSARISIDDFVSDSPLSICFSPTGEVVPKTRTYSFVDGTPLERASGWTNSAPQSPLASPDPESYPPYLPYPMYDLDAKTCEESLLVDGHTPPSRPCLQAIANDCASCGVDMDVSCLDALDEQLLISPMACFTELCWAAAVRDEPTSPSSPPPPPPTAGTMMQAKNPRSRPFKLDDERAFLSLPSSPLSSPLAKEFGYLGSFERTRPLAAKITLPLDSEMFPHACSSPFSESHDTLSTFQEKRPLAHYILYGDPDGHSFASPDHQYFDSRHGSLDVPPATPRRRLEKRSGLMTTTTVTSSSPSLESLPSPPPLGLRSSKSSQALRVISDVCTATFARARRKSPL